MSFCAQLRGQGDLGWRTYIACMRLLEGKNLSTGSSRITTCGITPGSSPWPGPRPADWKTCRLRPPDGRHSQHRDEPAGATAPSSASPPRNWKWTSHQPAEYTGFLVRTAALETVGVTVAALLPVSGLLRDRNQIVGTPAQTTPTGTGLPCTPL